jgi:tetratricopeptide (TPR) repeat protein
LILFLSGIIQSQHAATKGTEDAFSDSQTQQALIHAERAYALAQRGERSGAVDELDQAQRSFEGQTGRHDGERNVERLFCLTYSSLGEAAEAAAHYAAMAQDIFKPAQQHVDPARAERLQAMLLECRSHMPPLYFSIVEPIAHSKDQWTSLLKQKLATNDISFVLNPLEGSAEITNLAVARTRACTDEVAQAKALFEEVSQRAAPKVAEFPRPPTATEAFAKWNESGVSFQCEGLSFIYVALARAVGLRAYYVYVEQDCHGLNLRHACAAVFLKSGALLVDPNYAWFGVAHKKFSVLDDLQTAAIFLTETDSASAAEAAKRIAPDLTPVCFVYFRTLAHEGRWGEAQSELDEMMREHSDAPTTYYARAEKEQLQGNIERAISLLCEGIEKAPQEDILYGYLAYLYAQTGDWTRSAENYQNLLRFAVDRRTADTAREGLALANARNCEAKGDLKAALTNYDDAIRLNSSRAEYYAQRGATRQASGDLAGALSDYDAAIRLKPDFPPFYLARGFARETGKQWSAAKADYARAEQLQPGIENTLVRRNSKTGPVSDSTPAGARTLAGAAVLCSLAAAGVSAGFVRRRRRRSVTTAN